MPPTTIIMSLWAALSISDGDLSEREHLCLSGISAAKSAFLHETVLSFSLELAIARFQHTGWSEETKEALQKCLVAAGGSGSSGSSAGSGPGAGSGASAGAGSGASAGAGASANASAAVAKQRRALVHCIGAHMALANDELAEAGIRLDKAEELEKEAAAALVASGQGQVHTGPSPATANNSNSNNNSNNPNEGNLAEDKNYLATIYRQVLRVLHLTMCGKFGQVKPPLSLLRDSIQRFAVPMKEGCTSLEKCFASAGSHGEVAWHSARGIYSVTHLLSTLCNRESAKMASARAAADKGVDNVSQFIASGPNLPALDPVISRRNRSEMVSLQETLFLLHENALTLAASAGE